MSSGNLAIDFLTTQRGARGQERAIQMLDQLGIQKAEEGVQGAVPQNFLPPQEPSHESPAVVSSVAPSRAPAPSGAKRIVITYGETADFRVVALEEAPDWDVAAGPWAVSAAALAELRPILDSILGTKGVKDYAVAARAVPPQAKGPGAGAGDGEHDAPREASHRSRGRTDRPARAAMGKRTTAARSAQPDTAQTVAGLRAQEIPPAAARGA